MFSSIDHSSQVKNAENREWLCDARTLARKSIWRSRSRYPLRDIARVYWQMHNLFLKETTAHSRFELGAMRREMRERRMLNIDERRELITAILFIKRF